MNFFKKLFSKSVEKEEPVKEEPVDVMKIAKVIGPSIDKIAKDVFITYRENLLSEPITYIVPAVWGAKKDGALTTSQMEMHGQIAPVIKEMIEAFKVKKDLSVDQKFAIGFLIRRFIISKITYMIELVKNRGTSKTTSEDQSQDLENIKPMGNA